MKKRWLVLHPGTPEESIVHLERAFYQFGRNEDASIRLPNPRVSGLHASLVLKEHSATLLDLDSTNGTQVNGRKVKSADLKDHDEIRLAEIRLLFREEELSDGPSGAFVTALDLPPESEGARKLFERLQKAGAAPSEIRGLQTEWLGLEKSAQQLETFYRMLEVTLRSGGLDELAGNLLRETARIVGLEVCGIYLKETETFHILEEGRLSCETKDSRISGTVLDQVLGGGTPVFLESIGSDSGILGFKSLMNLKIQSLLCLPLADSRGTVLGALYCVSRKLGALSALAQDLHFLRALTFIVTVSLDEQKRLSLEKEHAGADERRKQEERFIPVIRRLQERNESLALRAGSGGLFGLDHPSMAPLRDFTLKAAKNDMPILITGETGVGKTLLAREIHALGRPDTPFITVDCTTLPGELIESELFGHEKGAFTGAVARKAGRAALAKNGTLFIDEIGDLPLALQGKLLRLAQSGEFEGLGSVETQRCQARLVFATNRDLQKEIKAGHFREDLYFRLNVLRVEIPPLRDRRDLITPIAEYFLKLYAERNKTPAKGFSPSAKQALERHGWPGNIRELENAVMRGLLNGDGGWVDAPHLELTEYSTAVPGGADTPDLFRVLGNENFDLKEARERVDRVYIARALDLTGRNVSQAARKLNISRNALMDLIQKYGL